MTVEVHEARRLPVVIPADPQADYVDQILAEILREGPAPEVDDPTGDNCLGLLDWDDVASRRLDSQHLEQLRLAGAPLLDGPVDGAAVAALLADLDLGSLPDDAVVAAIAAASRLASWAAGVEVAATRELSRRTEAWRGVSSAGGVKELLSAHDLTALEVAAALSVSHQSADNRVELAAALGRLPGSGWRWPVVGSTWSRPGRSWRPWSRSTTRRLARSRLGSSGARPRRRCRTCAPAFGAR